MLSFLRFLSRNKLYTIIEVVGLSIALAFVVFIATFVAGEIEYDTELKNTENIWLGHSEGFSIMSYTVGDVLVQSYPEVEEVCRFLSTTVLGGVALEMTVNGETFPQKAIIADTSFFRFFTFPFVEGQAGSALKTKDAAAVSESFANLHFPNMSPIGRTLQIKVGEQQRNLEITGVYKDIKRSVFPSVDIIYGIQHVKDMYPDLLREGNGTTVNFFRLSNGTDHNQLQDKALEKLKENDILYECGVNKKFFFSPFSEIHYGVCENHFPFVGEINLNFIMLFGAAGILLLVFAILNYISLTVAQTGFRAKEMAARRMLGEQKYGIVLRYVKEALLLTVVSFAFALLLIVIFEPYFSGLLQKEVDFSDNITPQFAAAVLISLFVISFLAGAVPAYMVSRQSPVRVIKGELAGTSRMTLGKVFICVQNSVAMATLCIALAMATQLNLLLERDTGYNKDNVIIVDGAQKGDDYLVDELLQQPYVQEVGRLQFSPAQNGFTGWGVVHNGENVQLEVMYGDSSAFRMMEFAVMSVSPDIGFGNNTLWLTEGAMQSLGLDWRSANVVLSGQSYGISGIIKDFQKGSRSIEECAAANMVWLNCEYSDEQFGNLRQLAVKVHGNEDEAVAKLTQFYAGRKPQIHFYILSQNSIYRQYFAPEENNLKLIATFTFLVVMLSAMAMLAMSTYYTKQNARNWSVRKVFGCSRREVFMNVIKGFMKVVFIAAVIAVPLAYFVVGQWLKGYPYRIDNGWWIYAAAFAIAALVAVVSISWQAFRLMNANPVEELKKGD